MIAGKPIVDATEALGFNHSQIGAKAANLARLLASGMPVPRFVVLTASAVNALDQIEPHVDHLTEGGRLLAVRSSSPEEDDATGSFAGLLESHLNVDTRDLAARIEQIRRSARSQRVSVYRQHRGLTGPPPACAVIVQSMLEPRVSGVAFGADPVTGDRSVCVVSAVAGCAVPLVDGYADGQTWRIDGDDRIVSRETAGGTPLLTDAQVLAVGALTRRAEALLGGAQDVEWAIEGSKLWVVQSRPIASLKESPLSQPVHPGTRRVWDNANISESYGGITTPMTFSFARSVYEGVYRAFCGLMGVPRSRIETNDDMFAQMLGFFRGRVYYNLFNWYRLIALLPGYASNRGFMEQMMGVREPMPDEVVGDLAHVGLRGRLGDRAQFVRSVAGLAARYAMLERMTRRFDSRVDQALSPPARNLQTMPLNELAAEYRRLERALLSRWDAPLVNDFFTMVCFGMLRKSAERWGGQQGWAHVGCMLGGMRGRGEKTGWQPVLRAHAPGGTREMISTEPSRRIAAMGEMAASIDRAAEILCEANREHVAKLLEEQTELREAISDYIDCFGDRCMEELKLETDTLHEDPTVLWRAIGHSAMRFGAEGTGHDDASRHAADARRALNRALRRRPLRRFLINGLIRRARRHLVLRENMRFQRARVFGRVRRIVRQMGDSLAGAGTLDRPDDVFYLEIGEVLGFIEGGITCPDLSALTTARRAAFEQYAQQPAPPERFETYGPAHLGEAFDESATDRDAHAVQDAVLQGTGCYPGVVRAIVQCVHDPRHTLSVPGHILVAERTDPGWVMLFPGVAGVLVQRGSILSHSATLAREMGIPTIVGIPNLMDRIHDGDLVELDGATGQVRFVASGASAPTSRRSAG